MPLPAQPRPTADGGSRAGAIPRIQGSLLRQDLEEEEAEEAEENASGTTATRAGAPMRAPSTSAARGSPNPNLSATRTGARTVGRPRMEPAARASAAGGITSLA